MIIDLDYINGDQRYISYDTIKDIVTWIDEVSGEELTCDLKHALVPVQKRIMTLQMAYKL